MISSYLGKDDLFSASQVCQHWRSVLTSFASQWTRIPCRNIPRTISSLERCGSLPIQLRLDHPFSNEALETVLLHGNEIVSLTVDQHPKQLPQLQQLFTFSRPSVERLHVYNDHTRGRRTDEQAVHQIWQDFPSLRELFVSQHFVPAGQFTAPNLVHLALERTADERNIAVQTILAMLRGCPLLETLLLDYSDAIPPATIHDHPAVCFPHLRAIEVGRYEVHSGLMTYLHFPPNVAVGLRMMRPDDFCGNISRAVRASTQHVLARIDIRCITLAAAMHNKGYILLRICFEGPRGSLEVTVGDIYDPRQPQDVLFGPRGVLFSHSPHIENVTKLQIAGCFFNTDQGLDRVSAAMPDVDTISFFQCGGPHTFGLLALGDPSSPPFPRLKCVMVLGPGSGLEEMAKRRRALRVPLETLIIGRGHGDFECNPLEDYTALEALVDNLRTGCPVEILEWGTGNEILSRWSTIKTSAMVGLGWDIIGPCLIAGCSTFFMNHAPCLGFAISMLRGRMLNPSGVGRNKRGRVLGRVELGYVSI